MTKPFIIAVDGPSASGKGTLARKMAAHFDFAYLDTGALYRAVGLAVLESGGDPATADDVQRILPRLNELLTTEMLARPDIRSEAASQAASKVAAMPEVRASLRQFQLDFASHPPDGKSGAILDGRDIGTVICPDAPVKFFVTADVEERARRRFKDVEPTGVTYDQVLEDLKQRDLRDSTRKDSPTAIAQDAHVLDTTTMPAAEVLEQAIRIAAKNGA